MATETQELFIPKHSSRISAGLTAKAEQHIRVVLKPKPWFLSYKTWMKLASRFVYIERTAGSFTLEGVKD